MCGGCLNRAPCSLGGVLERSDAVVNLAGEGIADRRWTAVRKAAILDSRVADDPCPGAGHSSLCNTLHGSLSAPPPSASTARAGRTLTEQSASGSDFLATVCQSWEREATRAAGVARVVLLRTGVVLAGDGGALPRMALPFRFFVGGRLGSGRQYVSWIHRRRLGRNGSVGAARTPTCTGPLNLTAPAPVTNAEFTRAARACDATGRRCFRCLRSRCA